MFKFQPALLEDALGYSQLRFWGRRNSEFWPARGIRVCAVPNWYVCYNIISRKGMCVLKILVTFLYRNLSSLYFNLCVYRMVTMWGIVFINHTLFDLLSAIPVKVIWEGWNAKNLTLLWVFFYSAAVRYENKWLSIPQR